MTDITPEIKEKLMNSYKDAKFYELWRIMWWDWIDSPKAEEFIWLINTGHEFKFAYNYAKML